MSFLGDFLRDHKQQKGVDDKKTDSNTGQPYEYHECYSNITIYIYSSKALSKEQRKEIFSTVKDGIRHNDIAEKISVEIMRRTQIMKIPSVKKTPEFVSVNRYTYSTRRHLKKVPFYFLYIKCCIYIFLISLHIFC